MDIMTELILHTPSHPDKFAVEFSPGEFSSSLKSLKAFTTGETMSDLKCIIKGPKAYTSVQCGIGVDDNIELNSDLVYMNHSCEPNVAVDLSSPDRSEWHLRALKDIHPGDDLGFFYPSTEWDMVQSFGCRCEQPTCLGTIQGAKYLSEAVILTKGFINPWILQMVRERDAKAAEFRATETLGPVASAEGTCHVVPQMMHMVQA